MQGIYRISENCIVNFNNETITHGDEIEELGHKASLLLGKLIEFKLKDADLPYEIIEDLLVNYDSLIDPVQCRRDTVKEIRKKEGAKAKGSVIGNKRGLAYYLKEMPVLMTDDNKGELRNKEPNYFNKIIIGRYDNEKELVDSVANNKVTFVTGINGIGKTSFVESFIIKYRNKFRNIVYLNYNDSIIDLITNDSEVAISNFKRKIKDDGSLEDKTEYFNRKINRLKQITSTEDLFIIDDFDSEDENFKRLISINAKFIMISSCNLFLEDYININKVQILPLKAEFALQLFFTFYTRNDITEKEILELYCVFDLVDFHTLAIIIIAKQMMQNRKRPSQVKNDFNDSILKNMKQSIAMFPMEPQKKAYDIISSIIDLNKLTKKELEYLLLMALIVPAEFTVSEIDLWNNDTDFYYTIDNLHQKGYIDICQSSDVVTMHPIIKEIVIEKCMCYLDAINDFYNLYLQNYRDYEIYALPYTKKKNYAIVNKNFLKAGLPVSNETKLFMLRSIRILGFVDFLNEAYCYISIIKEAESKDKLDDYEKMYLYYSEAWLVATKQRHYSDAISLYEKSIKFINFEAKKENDRHIMSELYADYGVALCKSKYENYMIIDEVFNKSIEYLNSTSQRDKNYYLRLTWLLTFKVDCMLQFGFLDKAEDLLDFAEKIHKEHSGDEDIYLANILKRKSEICFKKGQYENALQIIERGFYIYCNYYDSNIISNIEHYEYMGDLCYYLHSNDLACEYYIKAKKVAEIWLDSNSVKFQRLDEKIRETEMKKKK